MTSICLALEIIRLHPDPQAPSEVACAGCRGDLVVHQPDAQVPERLLGTCPCCSAWFLIDTAAAIMVRLPDEDALRDA
jgi:hypothetical protein